jgi:phage terminase large subunit
MDTEQIVQIPYRPRALQKVVGKAMRTHRFGVLVCHRRWGKSVCGVNVLQQGALMCEKPRPRFAYIGPTYRQAKATVWDYLKFYARPIPGIVFNESELRADYPNGGQVRIYGGDDPDSLRGLYFDGVVVDEYGLHQSDIFSTVLRPALSDREGWALFLGTPNGRNQFYDMIYGTKTWVGAKDDPTWFYACYKASETGVLPVEELAAARKDMTADEYAQEYECSFEAAVKGAIYAAELESARSAGRVCGVPYDPVLPVDTDWDLGVGDSTAIWFSQSVRSGEVRVIDYYEASGEGLPHYAQVLKDKGYSYGQHWAPFDIAVKELGSGRTRIETASSLGIRFNICPKVDPEDGIHAARMLFPRCYFDSARCKAGLEALQHYRRDYNTRLNEFKATPVHDWSSHGADAFRYLAVRHQTPKEKRPGGSYRPPTGPMAWAG